MVPRPTTFIVLCALLIYAGTVVCAQRGTRIPWWRRHDLTPQEKVYYEHNLRGNAYYGRRDYARAYAEYDTMVRLDPKKPDGYLQSTWAGSCPRPSRRIAGR